MLAKRFAMMYKNYRKLSIKFLGKDPVISQIPEQPVDVPLTQDETKEETKLEDV